MTAIQQHTSQSLIIAALKTMDEENINCITAEDTGSSRAAIIIGFTLIHVISSW